MLRRFMRSPTKGNGTSRGGDLEQFGLAAVDVETTGLFPGAHDRVVEIGVVLFTLDGARQGEFESVLNPGRDLGAQHIHGLTMADLVHAPTFADVSGALVNLLRERIVVAHNASFDVGFLEAEFRLASIETPPLPHLCTMRLVAGGASGRRLSDLCARLGVEHRERHTAIGDARAAADVLTRWYHSDPSRAHLTLEECGCRSLPAPERWPSPKRRAVAPLARSEASRNAANDRGYLARLVETLPAPLSVESPDEAAYLNLLEIALEDRHISLAEADELAKLAQDVGLGPDSVRRLHDGFFEALVGHAWADGHLSRVEAADLRLTAEFLGIDPSKTAAALRERAEFPHHQVAVDTPVEFSVRPGMTVCFTGALRATIYGQGVSREQAHHIAADGGLVVQDSVTKKLDLLVIADPLSLSGKAKKAREYGTRIVAEAVFWNALGIEFD